MDETKRAAILDAVRRIREKGGTAIKVEFEAQFGRGYDDDDEYCHHCDEGQVRCYEECDEGYVPCSNCEGAGYVPLAEGGTPRCDCGEPDNCNEAATMECPECEGSCDERCPNECDEGWLTCGECDGDYENAGEPDGWDSARRCLDFVMEQLGVMSYAGDHTDHSGYEAVSPTDWLSYVRFYNDGSVDSELTATVKIDTDENAFKLVDLSNAFAALGREIDCEFDVEGAGLHMAIIFNERAYYPDHADRLPNRDLENFRRSMKQLLPALYFLAAHNDHTRPVIDFRQPRISIGLPDRTEQYSDSDIKYSAIHYYGNAMEFRVFDTCYDHPEEILDNLVVMANCLKFLSPRYHGLSIEKQIRGYNFGHDHGRELSRLYTEVTHLDMLSIGLRHLKPSYYTVNQLKQQRGFKLNKGVLRKLEAIETRKAEAGYEEYCERFKQTLIYQEAEAVASNLRNLIEGTVPDELRGKTKEEMEEMVAERVKRDVERQQAKQIKKPDYIEQKLQNFRENRQGRQQVRFA